MKNIYIFCLVMLVSASGFAQDVIDKISNETCDCLGTNIPSDTKSEEFEMQLGLCMIKSSQAHAKELKKEYKIDVENITEENMTKLGELVGARMAFTCPSFLNYIQKSGIMEEMAGDAEAEEESALESSEVTITEVRTEQFNTVVCKDENGRELKFLWLEYFNNSDLLLGPPYKWQNKKATVTFYVQDIYNPKLADYVPYKVIADLIFAE